MLDSTELMCRKTGLSHRGAVVKDKGFVPQILVLNAREISLASTIQIKCFENGRPFGLQR